MLLLLSKCHPLCSGLTGDKLTGGHAWSGGASETLGDVSHSLQRICGAIVNVAGARAICCRFSSQRVEAGEFDVEHGMQCRTNHHSVDYIHFMRCQLVTTPTCSSSLPESTLVSSQTYTKVVYAQCMMVFKLALNSVVQLSQPPFASVHLTFCSSYVKNEPRNAQNRISVAGKVQLKSALASAETQQLWPHPLFAPGIV